MKQYTTPEQTAKLIELGFERPTLKCSYGKILVGNSPYSMGELIEMLNGQCIEIVQITDYWRIGHEDCDKCSDELIDALYEMIVKLKEEKII